jgi:hypothetical protein
MPEWQALVLAPAAFAIAVFVWLTFAGQRGTIDLAEPFSLTLPFFPMRRYPIRFWLLCGVVLFVAGACRTLASVILGQHLTGATMALSIGVGILIAVLGWLKWNRDGVLK